MNDYRKIADAVGEEIASGKRKPGERLPPQRDFAYERGIAASTASRVYAELAKRGLVTGEVGRGTFVRLPASRQTPALTEPATSAIDLELNSPIVSGQSAIVEQSLKALLHATVLEQLSRPAGATGTRSARTIAANFVGRGAWHPDAEAIMFTGNGRQAIAAALSALAPPGSRIGVEALTYPVIKGVAARLGITLVPIGCDSEGMVPAAIRRAHNATPLNCIYVQPSLHNPLGMTMSLERRGAIASILAQSDLVAIEDGVYGFLVDEEPLAKHAPDHVVLVDSLSKRIAPGTTLGVIIAPAHMREKMLASVRSGAWSPSGLPLALGLQLMLDGSAHQIGKLKREDAKARHALARRVLSTFEVSGDARAYHIWASLSDHWRAETFAIFAARQGVSVLPASAFASSPGHAPNAIRLALSAPTMPMLATGLNILNSLAASSPHLIE